MGVLSTGLAGSGLSVVCVSPSSVAAAVVVADAAGFSAMRIISIVHWLPRSLWVVRSALGGPTFQPGLWVVKCITALPHSAGRVARDLPATSAISSVMLVKQLPHLTTLVGAYLSTRLVMVVCFSLGCLSL